jgi:DNA-binding NarL/FixJ family response regulator
MKTQKIYIVDDHELFREGVKLMLEKFKHIEVIGESPTGEQFLEALTHINPDIVLMDIDLPGISGQVTCKRAIARNPDMRIIAVSNHSDETYYYEMLEAGARGYVAKQLSVGELLTAIEHVANGEYYFSDKILKEILVRQTNTNKSQHFEATNIPGRAPSGRAIAQYLSGRGEAHCAMH